MYTIQTSTNPDERQNLELHLAPDEDPPALVGTQAEVGEYLGVPGSMIWTWYRRRASNGFPEPVGYAMASNRKARARVWDIHEVQAWFIMRDQADASGVRRDPATGRWESIRPATTTKPEAPAPAPPPQRREPKVYDLSRRITVHHLAHVPVLVDHMGKDLQHVVVADGRDFDPEGVEIVLRLSYISG